MLQHFIYLSKAGVAIIEKVLLCGGNGKKWSMAALINFIDVLL